MRGNSRDRWSMAFLRIVPEPILTAPERVFLKFATLLIGVGILLAGSRPGSVVNGLPRWVAVELALTFIVGGGAGLYGIFAQSRSVERLGLAATALAAVVYGVLIAVVRGWGGIPAVVIFSLFAAASVTRLIVSSAAHRINVTAAIEAQK